MSIANKIQTVEEVKDDIEYLRTEYVKSKAMSVTVISTGDCYVPFEAFMEWLGENKEFVRLANKCIKDLKGLD